MNWIRFFIKARYDPLAYLLYKMTLEGYFTGEIKATRELLAQENHIAQHLIGVEINIDGQIYFPTETQIQKL